MGFLNPWFLGGLLAVGLPVWLHLLKRHKTDPQPFPSLMFFEHREQSSVQHRRLDYILLFILRMLMLVLLALLFASSVYQPLDPQGSRQEAGGGRGGPVLQHAHERRRIHAPG